ncbi:MAG: bifunctional oligoribonuclease/PAP phosphatase NrnA [Bacilli bacterium]|nr:bifunctional oligoribonuclease/PAP phosphatase NrnA [Bacilli bacterium]
MDREIVERIINKIKEYDTIIIHRHIRPDGDAIGTSLGLRDGLRESFPNKNIYSVGADLPDYLSFVGEEDVVQDELYENALAIVVDTAVADRVYDQRFLKAKEIIKIDHHIVVDSYGVINYVQEKYGSCSQIIAEMFYEFPDVLKMNKSAARYLLLAMITDTGRFKFTIDGGGLRMAAFLVDFGIDVEMLYANLYTKDKEVYKLTGWVYDNFEISENGVAYIKITKDIKKKYHVSNEDASNTVNLLDSIRGSMIWLLFNEQDEEIRVRLRSRFIEVDKIANNYKGGGHANAAGATVYSFEEADQLILECDQLLKEYKENNKDKF